MSRSFTDASTDKVSGTVVPVDSTGFSLGAWILLSALTTFGGVIEVGAGNQLLALDDNAGVGSQRMTIEQAYSTATAKRHATTGKVATGLWQCWIGTGDGSLTGANYHMFYGTQALAMANVDGSTEDGTGTRNVNDGRATIGNRPSHGGATQTLPGRIAQAFMVPWAMTLDETERFRLGDWTVLYAHGQPRFFLPLQGAGLYDLSGSF